jgi:hypothetical protein
MKKNIYLLSQAKEFEIRNEGNLEYDYKEQINFVTVENEKIPAIYIEKMDPTHSKTMRAPGDDDPDDELCY